MKSRNSTLLLALLMGLGFSVRLFAADIQNPPTATLIQASGLVEVKRNDVWRAAETGDFLYQGDKIRTSKTGQAQIMLMADRSILAITRNSYLELLPDGKRGKLTLQRLGFEAGQILAKIKKGSAVDVESSIAVCSVKGTEFSTEMGTDNLALYVFDGTVEMANKYGRLDVNPNEKAVTSKSQAPLKNVFTRMDQDAMKKEFVITTSHLLKLGQAGLAMLEKTAMPVDIKFHKKTTQAVDNFLSRSMTVISESDQLKLSAKPTAGFGNQAVIQSANGVATVFAMAEKAGTYRLTATAEQSEPLAFQIKVTESKPAAAAETLKADLDTKKSGTPVSREIRIIKGKITIDKETVPLEIILEKK